MYGIVDKVQFAVTSCNFLVVSLYLYSHQAVTNFMKNQVKYSEHFWAYFISLKHVQCAQIFINSFLPILVFDSITQHCVPCTTESLHEEGMIVPLLRRL